MKPNNTNKMIHKKGGGAVCPDYPLLSDNHVSDPINPKCTMKQEEI
ncbi:MAG: hypothetical protein GXP56_09590 [Deltaproteobacteria bacterium]|nr:hypothetical protein [Deltaproteobacteria bacterium]